MVAAMKTICVRAGPKIQLSLLLQEFKKTIIIKKKKGISDFYPPPLSSLLFCICTFSLESENSALGIIAVIPL